MIHRGLHHKLLSDLLQFYAIEIARNRLGLNDEAHEIAKKERAEEERVKKEKKEKRLKEKAEKAKVEGAKTESS